MVARPRLISVSLSGIWVSTPGKPQSTVQMSLRVFSSGECGAWSVAITSIVPSAIASHSGCWLRASRTGGLTRSAPADDAGKARVIVARQQHVVRAGLAGDVNTARLGLAQGPQFLGRRDVQDMD